jgi:membrane protease YdiL (CAAX protease family)
MAEQGRAGAARRGEPWLAVEFATLYLGAPLLLALAAPADWLWPVLFGLTAVALLLLALTPGFAWGELARGWTVIDWRTVAAVAAATAAASALLVWWLVPGQALWLPRRATGLWLAILALYPLLSALPQELIFRVLFFRRYGALFPSRGAAVFASAATFALAHLFFWNWVALALTLAGGVIFALGYLGRGFALALVLHAVCGWIVFTSGLGRYFYHGAIGP